METWLSGLASTGFGIRLHVPTIDMPYRLHILKHPPSMIYSESYKYRPVKEIHYHKKFYQKNQAHVLLWYDPNLHVIWLLTLQHPTVFLAHIYNTVFFDR
jgi:hypothetical protein